MNIDNFQLDGPVTITPRVAAAAARFVRTHAPADEVDTFLKMLELEDAS